MFAQRTSAVIVVEGSFTIRLYDGVLESCRNTNQQLYLVAPDLQIMNSIMTGIDERPFATTSAFLIDEGRERALFYSESSNETNESYSPTKPLRNFHAHGRVCGGAEPGSSNPDVGDTNEGEILRFLLVRVVLGGFLGTMTLFALSYLASAPPMHWFYEMGNAAGPATVYLPGGGFSGFWFHLGYLHAFADRHDLHDYDYYCFSAGCLGILSVFLNRSLEEVYDTALASQNAWKSGNRSRFEIIEFFFDELIPPETEDDCLGGDEGQLWLEDDNIDSDICVGLDFLPRIKILVTTPTDDGYIVLESKNRNELKEYIMRTTWIPYLTGGGLLMPTTERDVDGNQIIYLDGAFSRNIHPRCEVEWNLPLMWETLVHTFSPGLSREQVQSLWERGKTYEYPVPAFTRTTAANVTHVVDSSRVTNITDAASDPLGSDDSVNSDGHCLPT